MGAAGGTVPAGGEVLQGIGTAATWLQTHAVVGRRLAVDEQVRDSSGRAVPLTGRAGIVSAGPILGRDGRLSIDAATEGEPVARLSAGEEIHDHRGEFR